MSVSNQWVSTNSAPGHYGTGYWYAATGSTSDAATFWFHLPAAGTYTIDAWWTPGTNRANDADFRMVDEVGNTLGVATVNLQQGGNGWGALGSYAFPAGWNAVRLSRDAQAGKVVIADAIRVR